MVGRKDWVQADLRCLMCGRVLGRLVGAVAPAGLLKGGLPRFAAFRPADTTIPAVRLSGGEQFRCSTCGGGVIMDELETFSTYEDVPEEGEKRPRRGRPPKPWRSSGGASWLDELGIAG